MDASSAQVVLSDALASVDPRDLSYALETHAMALDGLRVLHVERCRELVRTRARTGDFVADLAATALSACGFLRRHAAAVAALDGAILEALGNAAPPRLRRLAERQLSRAGFLPCEAPLLSLSRHAPGDVEAAGSAERSARRLAQAYASFLRDLDALRDDGDEFLSLVAVLR